MSGDVAVRVEGIGKRYEIGALKERHDTLRDQIGAAVSRAARPLRGFGSGDEPQNGKTHIWALRDVTFEVERGEVVGIIGANGAGKSTLLKLLSRITEPTEGQATIRGRVGSILEVGTGFHPELTGRENTFLNGALMGMKQAEIRRKFDDIVSFAEIETFIDTPVKRYSSGMYVRLAFAVAAFLEPDVLIVDEVLAVGDSRFQKRCLGKMGSVAREGRTVLVVSHNMGAINQLCPRTIWLDRGRIRDAGETRSVVAAYLSDDDQGADAAATSFPEDLGKDSQLRYARLVDDDGSTRQRFSCDEPITVELTYEVRRPVTGLYGCFQISASDGTPVLVSYSYDMVPNPLEELATGSHLLRLTIPPRSLAAGDYRLQFSVGRGLRATAIVDDPGTICSFTLEDPATTIGNARLGFFSTLLEWSVTDAVRLPADPA